MPFLVLSLMLVSLVLSAGFCAALLRVTPRYGLFNKADGQLHKLGDRRLVPNTGGVAIFLAIALPMAGCMIAIWMLPMEWWFALGGFIPAAEDMPAHVQGLRQTTGIGGGILAGLSLIHLMGLVDDRRPLGPYLKLAIELALALLLVLLCDVRVLHVLMAWGTWGMLLSTLVSVAWIVVIINAMNFLDNMDGLSAGVGATIATLYLAATLIGGQWFVAGLAALLLGGLLGFLLFNFPPAKMIMGDGGSLAVGLLLAVISVRTTYFETLPPTIAADVSPGLSPGQWYGVLMPLMMMAIPLYDVVSVTLIRLLHGQSPLRGDLNHFSHRLVRKGLSSRRAVVLIWMCTLATGLGGVMLGSLNHWQAILAAAQTLTILAVLAVMERGAEA